MLHLLALMPLLSTPLPLPTLPTHLHACPSPPLPPLQAKENNFKAVLESIRDLLNEDCVLPPWLHDILLGYGDPGAAQYQHMEGCLQTVDFKDTFLDTGGWAGMGFKGQAASVVSSRPRFSCISPIG